MALVQCNECGNEVSTDSVTCPNCGYPIKPPSPQQPTPVRKGIKEHKKESIIYFLDMEKHEKEGAIYILGAIGLVVLILILVSLTHVIL